jgi:hypothetical protein
VHHWPPQAIAEQDRREGFRGRARDDLANECTAREKGEVVSSAALHTVVTLDGKPKNDFF